MNINKENVKKWIAVMRDPETVQNTSGLYFGEDGSMCALGCAYEAFGAGPNHTLLKRLFEVAEIPYALATWAVYQGREESIFTLNDDYKLTLPEIADLVEQQLLNS